MLSMYSTILGLISYTPPSFIPPFFLSPLNNKGITRIISASWFFPIYRHYRVGGSTSCMGLNSLEICEPMPGGGAGGLEGPVV